MLKNLKITISLDESFEQSDLRLRHTLVDTIEDRGIGDVWDEGMGEDYMEINVELDPDENKIEEVNSILESLGVLKQSKLLIEDLE